MKFSMNFMLLALFLEIFGEYAIGVAGQGGKRQRGNCPTLTLENGRVKIRSRAARCPDVDVEDGVQMTVDPKYKGALLEFSCDDGRTLEGVDNLYCDGTSWNADPPRCLNTIAEKECDFESQDLCGWTQDTDDNFDWIWHTGTTSTARTGPKTDHTLEYLNETTGHYLYIETSSPRRPGDVVIAATRKNSYVSDIAIDDVKIYNCSEDITEDTTDSETTLSMEDTSYALHQTTEAEVVITEVEEFVMSTSNQPSSIQLLNRNVKSTISSEPEPEQETTNKDFPTTSKVKPETPSKVTIKVTTPKTTKQNTISSTFKVSKTTATPKFTTKAVKVSTNMSSSIFSTTTVTESTDELVTEKTIMPTKPSKTKLSTKNVKTENSSTSGQRDDLTTQIDMSENEIDSTKKPNVFENDTSIDNSSTSTTDLPNIIHVNWGLVGDEDRLPTKPLLIGVGVGVAVGLLIIVIVIFAWIKRKRRKEAEFFEDEMAPIAKNACNEW
ncbi:hypothetical protein KUTeg_023259 [Tegillarca granosa]|uniref:Uncharacterized protein n=1 Tax=Tegillarca granosa TaxID=220873 RepID=A0ABQ9E1I0_TEGGR|nr:hypothetical protein KUTeg_023259 [Tegillarca granosa]